MRIRTIAAIVAAVTVTGGGSYSYTYLDIPGAPHDVYTQVG